MYHLTTPQQNIWNMQRFYAGTSISNNCGAIFFGKKCILSVMQDAINLFLKQQEGMRLQFREESGEAVQYVSEVRYQNFPIKTFRDRTDFETFAESFAKEPFQLTDSPMYRICLFELDGETGALLCASHLISDAWTFSVIANRVWAVYASLIEGEAPEEAPYSYLDYVAAEDAYFSSAKYQKSRGFWEQEYAQRPDVSLVKPGKPPVTYPAGHRYTTSVPPELSRSIDDFCASHKVSQAVLFEAALVTYLSRINPEHSQITIGIPVLNRSDRKEKATAGMYISTMPLSVALEKNETVESLCRKLSEKHFQLFRHQRYPYSHILRDLHQRYGFDGNLFDAVVSFQNAKIDGDVKTQWFGNGFCGSGLELHIDNRDSREGYTFILDYQTELFPEEGEIAHLSRRLLSVIEQMIVPPLRTLNQISIVSGEEFQQVVYGFNRTAADFPRDMCVHSLLSHQAALTPDRTAVIFENHSISFWELDNMSNALGHYLRSQGVGRGDLIPIIAKRSYLTFVAMFGVMKSGAAYLPVDPTYPKGRIAFILDEIQAKLALTLGYDDTLSIPAIDISALDLTQETDAMENWNTPDDLCYLTFTSGSTGKPKGTMVKHSGVVNLCTPNTCNIHGQILDTSRTAISTLQSCFDAFVLETVFPLVNGLTLVMTNEYEMSDGQAVAKLIEAHKVDLMMGTPSKMQLFLSDSSFQTAIGRLKAVVLGAEVFSPHLCNALKSHTDAVLYNSYGPTETTVGATFLEITDSNRITIGKPIANTSIYILDEQRRPLPVGVPGELYISGAGVGLGYWKREELTSAAFLEDPFVPGTRMYKSGDLACWNMDGQIEYLGRIDTQVKIRGLRIELGEIENAMEEFSGIGLSAVADKKDASGRQFLVGYYISQEPVDEKALRQHLKASLPNYMVPNYFLRLEEMPLTASGKTDRKALPNPDLSAVIREYIAPETVTEQRIAEIWESLLKTSPVGRTDDFFDLGGDSLVAIQLLSHLESAFGISVTAKDVMEYSVLSALADWIDHNGAAAAQTIPATGATSYELLPQQMAIYAVYSKNPDTLTYNMPGKLTLPESVDKAKLVQAMEFLLQVHPELKTCVRTIDGKILAVIDEDAVLNVAECQTEEAFVRPFDLSNAPLIHAAFCGNDLLIDMHHLIMDGTSMSIVLRDLAMLYAGMTPERPPVTYADYATHFHSTDFSEHRAWFQEMLRCDFEPIVLPEKKEKTETLGVSRRYQLEKALFDQAHGLAKMHKLTDTMVFLGAFGILMSKYSGQENVLSSIVMTNRGPRETQDVVGMFVNTLPVSLKAAGSTEDYWGRVRDLVMNLFQYQELPFAQIAEAVGMTDMSAVNTSFVYQADGGKQLTIDGMALTPQWLSTQASKFDLTFDLTPNPKGCEVRIEYNAGKYDQALIDRLFASFCRVVAQLSCGTIEEISVLSQEELETVTRGFNQTAAAFDRNLCVHQSFAERAAEHPDKTAVVFEGTAFTYRQLDEMSNSLAHLLRSQGVGPGDIVPIISRRSHLILVSIFGILKAGAAYMPVDPTYPKDRVDYMLDLAGAKLALTLGYPGKLEIPSLELTELDLTGNVLPLVNRNTPEDLCYIIFTSGSTGQPKGVTLCHRNVMNYAAPNSHNLAVSFAASHAQSIVSTTNIIFDIFVTESVMPLLNGLTVYFGSDSQVYSQKELAQLINGARVDMMQTTPTKMRSYMMDKENLSYLSGLKALILGGEALPADLYRELRANTQARIFNIYGPAETTVWSTNAEVTSEDITIGHPIANTRVYILDSHQRPVPLGVAGELCIAGDGVGKGYLNRPDLTGERFVADPFVPGATMYRTGDLASWRDTGEIAYLGRIDTQVKIRGLRIELGEIESVMASFPGIQLAAVTDKRDETGRQYLVGYYTSETEVDEKELRRILSGKLPKYMVPNYFLRLDAMPMTTSGKTDRKNLPVPEAAALEREYLEPVTATQQRIAEIWEELLRCTHVGRNDDFFELGGDSLVAIQLMAKLEQEFHIAVTVKGILENPVLEQLAAFVDSGSQLTATIQPTGAKQYQLLPQQLAIYAVCSRDPENLSYNMPTQIPLAPQVDRKKLTQCLHQLLDIHPELRTGIQLIDGVPVAVYDSAAKLVIEDVPSIDTFIRPFDLSRAPLVHVGFTQDMLLLDMHHIIMDGTSISIIVGDLAMLYAGIHPEQAPITFGDYASFFYETDFAPHKAWFKEALDCDFEPVTLPQKSREADAGISRYYRLDPEVFSLGKQAAKTHQLTDTMVFFGAFGILLSKFSGQKDVLSSIVMTNRVHRETANVVGMFVNTLPVAFHVKGSTGSYLEQVRQMVLNLFSYQELPFASIADAVGMRDKSVVNTSFVYQADGEKVMSLGDVSLEPQIIDTHTAKFDITFELTPKEEGCIVRIEYNQGKFSQELIDRLFAGYVQILRQLNSEAISDISVLSAKEQEDVLYRFNHTAWDYEKCLCIHQQFMRQAHQHPDKPAVVFKGQTFTFRQIDEMSNALAHILQDKGCGRGEVVPIISKRSHLLIVSMLAVLKTGAAYMLLDPAYPQDRIEYMVTEAKSRFALVNGSQAVLEGVEPLVLTEVRCENTEPVEALVTPEDLYCVIHTSGSTGLPKLSCLTHRNVSNFTGSYLSMAPEALCSISYTIVTFDAFILDTTLPLICGRTVVIAAEDQIYRQEAFERLMTQHKQSALFFTPTKLKNYLQLLQNKDCFAKVNTVILGGEIFDQQLGNMLFQICPHVRIYNIYGPTETTIAATYHRVEANQDITIGRPGANVRIYILDQDEKLAPIGVAGELCIAGDGVGGGYLNRPDLTEAQFRPDPFHSGQTMYKTGDLAAWRPDGQIDYLGRRDTQVKIRGLRIELGEIESVMSHFPGIQLAAVTDKRDETGRQYLVGYYTAETPVDTKALRQHLGEKLPQYMVPNYFMYLEEMPLTGSGKTDRKNLPVPEDTQRLYEAPETATEETISTIWEHMLNTVKIGRNDDFFDLGGDSLVAIQLQAKLEEAFRVEISVKDILENPMLSQLADFVDHAKFRTVNIQPTGQTRYALLPQQLAIYAVCSQMPDTLTYNMPVRLRLPERIDREKVAAAFRMLPKLHPELNTCIRMIDGVPTADFSQEVSLEMETYASEADFLRPFDLSKAPLLRAGFAGEYLLLDMHHIILDGTSVSVILQDLLMLYSGITPETPAFTYGDYASYFHTANFSAHRSFFREMLKCDFEPIALPEKRAKEPSRGMSRTYQMDPETYRAAHAVAKTFKLTDTMVFLGAYGILMSRFSGQPDVLSSIVMTNRGSSQVQNILGMFVNTLPVAFSVQGSTEAYLKRVRSLVMNLFEYQALPFASIAEAVGMQDKSVVNTSFIFQAEGHRNPMLEGELLQPESINTRTAKFDLTFQIAPGSDDCTIYMEYDAGKYDAELIDRLFDAYVRILRQLNQPNLEEISVLSEEETRRITYDLNHTEESFRADLCVHEAFMAQAAQKPEETAVVFEGQAFTYGQLDRMSNALARILREKGVGRGQIVPIIAKRSHLILAAMFGVLKAGAAYMPVDPSYPADRVKYMLELAQAKLALTLGYSDALGLENLELSALELTANTEPVENCNDPEDLCYIIFTSGSTGQPKGVTLCHRNVMNYASPNRHNITVDYVTRNTRSIVSTTNTIFDIFVTESLMPLVNGMTVYFANDSQVYSQKKLGSLIQENGVEVMQTTPTKMRSYIMDKDGLSYLKTLKAIILGGEALPADLYQELCANTDAAVFNIYGPAETTVWSTNARIESSDITIGRPIANTRVYILDDRQNPVPMGVAAELCIAGDGVGKGYLNRPDLTAERFLPDPFVPGKVMYRTGDLARFRANGEIEYLGRMDTQVKIRGQRIELGEIESVMSGFPGVRLAAVTDKRDENGRQYLVGYYTADEPLDEKTLRQVLSEKLPKYMVPNYFMHLYEMPMTASGKTDRKNLPIPEFVGMDRAYIAPETPTEERIAAIWEELLKTSDVGRSEDFFELGGDSLMAIQLLAKLETEFGIVISMKDILEHPTLSELAEFVDNAEAKTAGIPLTGETWYPLLPQQTAIYTVCVKDPTTLAYNMPTRIPLPDGVDREKLKECICKLPELHPELKTRIILDNGVPTAVRDENTCLRIQELAEESQFLRPFQLDQAPLAHVAFTQDALLLDLHHIIMDGTSISVILRDMSMLYAGVAPKMPGITYADYAHYFHRADFTGHQAYFKQMLHCDFEPMNLPERKVKASAKGEMKLYHIPRETFEACRSFAKANKLTDTMVFLGAYGILLSKYAGQSDVLSSVVMTNRAHPETADLVGMFVNTLPFYLSAAGVTSAYFAKTRDLVLNLLKYQELPFFSIAEAVGMSDKSVVNTSFVYQAEGEKTLSLGDASLQSQMLETGTTKFDLTLQVMPVEDSGTVGIEYNCGKYESSLIDRLFASYLRILENLHLETVEDIPVMSQEEYRQVVYDFNQTAVDYDKTLCVHDRFRIQCQKTPDKTALIYDGQAFTYQQIEDMSNAIANTLREKGCAKGQIVPIITKRSQLVVAGMLGVIKTGAAYMILDPAYPQDRIEYMVREAGATMALVYGNTAALPWLDLMALEDLVTGDPRPFTAEVTSEDLYCVLHTSGSTGVPKLTCLTHRNIGNFLNVYLSLVPTAECNISLTIVTFDAFIYDTIVPMVCGRVSVISTEEQIYQQAAFEQLLAQHKESVLFFTPTKLKNYLQLLQNKATVAKVNTMLIGGEVYDTQITDMMQELNPKTRLFNIYGPTETSIFISGHRIVPGDSDITIGGPRGNVRIYILDSHGNPVPTGVIGELCIGGDCVGMGYLNRPELTDAQFRPDPFNPGGRMYKTGDLAAWRADGEIYFIGRRDTQVKIRGLRIELGEVENVMRQFPGMELVAVADKRDSKGLQYLVGYYTGQEVSDEKALRAHLGEKLPKYMVPNYFMHLPEMPLTITGKTDRKNLPVPEFTELVREYVAPKNPMENILCTILADLFQLDRVGVTEDFFDLGGDSIRAIQYVAKAHNEGVDFDLQNVFDFPTVRQLCQSILSQTREDIVFDMAEFEKYQPILSRNASNEEFVPVKRELGNVLVTGATGFLGSHIVDALMRAETGKIYCLVRGGQERLASTLEHYFDGRYTDQVGQRILAVEGDITRNGLGDEMPQDVQTVIHCAATVKHYGSYSYFHKINVDGTENVLAYAKSQDARFLHVSTLSVAGSELVERPADGQLIGFGETDLYVGQKLDSVYGLSKFEAERRVLDAVLDGLDATIMRVGNLTNRASDLRFQPNYETNAFLKRMKVLLELGHLPDYMMEGFLEFSPIDQTAQAIVTLAQHSQGQTVFHPNTNRLLKFARLVEIGKAMGIPMEVVRGEDFALVIQEIARNPKTQHIYEALQNELDASGNFIMTGDVFTRNDYTNRFLESLGFQWDPIDWDYMSRYITYFNELGYFAWEDATDE